MESVRDRLRGALPASLKARDPVAVAALRSALAAIDNAEAVDADTPPGPSSAPGQRPGPADPASGAQPRTETARGGHASAPREAAAGPDPQDTVGQAEFAGTVVGLGAGEVRRRSLSEQEMREIVRREVAERQHAAHAYAAAGRQEQAERLRAEADVLSAFLGRPRSPPG